MKKKITKPFELLLDYEQKSLRHAVKLPEQQEHGNAWSGIGFRLNEHFYVRGSGGGSADARRGLARSRDQILGHRSG